VLKNIRAVLLLLLLFRHAFSLDTPQFIFLFIGDGMGLNQVFLTGKYLESLKKDKLVFLDPSWKFGLLKTDCIEPAKITDSGAGGTAIACGCKTEYGLIGLPDTGACESIAFILKKKKYRIGIITTVPINHATPACFYGHVKSRKNYDYLINDMIVSKFDFFAGGGILTGQADTAKSLYKNFDQALAVLKQAGFNLILNIPRAHKQLPIPLLPVIVIDTLIRNRQVEIKAAYSDEHNSLPYVIDRPEYNSRLALYTKSALTSLENDTGFFIMVEGGKIDWACHDNDAATAVAEILAFNDAIKPAYDFYKSHPENTLILVTADHETGGLSLGRGYADTSKSDVNNYGFFPGKLALQKKSLLYSDTATIGTFNRDAQAGWTTNEHTAMPVGIWSLGKRSEEFTGIFENAAIRDRILGGKHR